MECRTIEYQQEWLILQEAFSDYKRFTDVIEQKLNRIGVIAIKTRKHIKLVFSLGDNNFCVVISATPSDRYAGNQILRVFRRIYEQQ